METTHFNQKLLVELQQIIDTTSNILQNLKENIELPSLEKVKPNLDDYTSIKTYKDACIALNIKPLILSSNAFIGELEEDSTEYGYKVTNLPKHIIALIKLETISRALWGKTFRPKPAVKDETRYYYPSFTLYTKKELDEIRSKNRYDILSASTHSITYAEFGYLNTNYRSSHVSAFYGFHLCQETDEKAKYFGKQFIKLWTYYLTSAI